MHLPGGDVRPAAACALGSSPDDLRAELAGLPLPALLRYWHRLTWWTGVWPLFRHMSAHDLTLPETMMLRLIGRHTLNVAEVAESIALSHSAASRAVDRLVRAGLISRSEDPQDRRNKRLGLTESGLALVKEVEGVFGAELSELISDLPADSQEALAALFAQLLAAFLARHQGEEYTDWAREVGAWSTPPASAAPLAPAADNHPDKEKP